MMEFEGAENPQKKAWLEARLHASRDLWVSAAKRQASGSLETCLRRTAQGEIYPR